jgi:hypothetical protein
MIVEQSLEWELVGKTEVLGETCPNGTLSTNPIWPDMSLAPGRRCGKSATNHLGYGATKVYITYMEKYKDSNKSIVTCTPGNATVISKFRN